MSSRKPSISSNSSSSRAERTSLMKAMERFGADPANKHANTEISKYQKEIQMSGAKQHLDFALQMKQQGRLEDNYEASMAGLELGMKAAYGCGWEEGFSQMFKMHSELMRMMKGQRFKAEVDRLDRLVKRMKEVVDILGTEYGPDDDGLAAILSTATEQVVLGGLALARVIEMGNEGDGWEDRKGIDQWIEKGKVKEDRNMGSLWFLFQTIGRSFREDRQRAGGH